MLRYSRVNRNIRESRESNMRRPMVIRHRNRMYEASSEADKANAQAWDEYSRISKTLKVYALKEGSNARAGVVTIRYSGSTAKASVIFFGSSHLASMGTAGGGGYDKGSAAIASAFKKIEDEMEDYFNADIGEVCDLLHSGQREKAFKVLGFELIEVIG